MVASYIKRRRRRAGKAVKAADQAVYNEKTLNLSGYKKKKDAEADKAEKAAKKVAKRVEQEVKKKYKKKDS